MGIDIPIIDTENREEGNFGTFQVILTQPGGGAVLSAQKTATVTIFHDDNFTNMVNRIEGIMKMRAMKFSTKTYSWREQFEDALTMEGAVTETEVKLPSVLWIYQE